MALAALPSAAATLRSVLKSRCEGDSLQGAWRAAAAAAGVAGADAFLCHLSGSITAALECLASSADAARAQLQSVQIADKAHAEMLEANIFSAETSKRVSLERELCAVDGALERLRAERAAASDALASLGDAELVARHADLLAGLDAAEAQVLNLPTTVVESSHVELVVDSTLPQAGDVHFGRVVAPFAVKAADLSLTGVPLQVQPSETVQLSFVLQCPPHTSQSVEELSLSLAATAAATLVEASLEYEGSASKPLRSCVAFDVAKLGVTVSVAVPLAAPVGSIVCIGPVTIFGKQADGLPVRVAVTMAVPGAVGVSAEYAAQLQTWLPLGGSSSPAEWLEVYRATTHGFSSC